MGILIVYNEPTTSQVRQAKSRRHGGSGHLAGGCYDLRAEKDSALGARTDNKKALTGKIEVTLLSNRRRKAMAGRVFFSTGSITAARAASIFLALVIAATPKRRLGRHFDDWAYR
jgi:hypothetical protein